MKLNSRAHYCANTEFGRAKKCSPDLATRSNYLYQRQVVSSPVIVMSEAHRWLWYQMHTSAGVKPWYQAMARNERTLFRARLYCQWDCPHGEMPLLAVLTWM